MISLNQPVRQWTIFTLLLLIATSLLPVLGRTRLETNPQLSEQQAAHLPNLEPQKSLSDAKTKRLRELIQQSEQTITPILQQEVKTLLKSEQYQANKAVGERLAREVLQLPTAEVASEEKQFLAPVEGQIVVFVSASMPLATLRNYARSLVKVKGALVLRGGIEGLKKIGPTLAFSQHVLKIDPYCTDNCALFQVPLLIDPLLFRQHQITQVPAIAFQPEGVIQGCDRSSTAIAVDVIYGDISLKGALDRLQQLNPHSKLNDLITQMENPHVTY